MKSSIAQIRKQLGLSRERLADLLHLTSGAISNYENFSRRPPLETAYQIIDIAEIYGISKKLEDIYPRDQVKKYSKGKKERTLTQP